MLVKRRVILRMELPLNGVSWALLGNWFSEHRPVCLLNR